MPELAEVEFYRRRWDEAARGARVRRIDVNAGKKVFRGTDVTALTAALTGATLLESAAAAKQMRFRFSGGASLGIHLGMSGELTVVAPETPRGRHDHLVLETDSARLVFTDPRMFGRVLFHAGPAEPTWWTSIAPALTAAEFTREAVAAFLSRRRRAPIKAVLLMQERFPGVGNWMADEILWRAAIHPRRQAGSLTPKEVAALWRECRRVAALALRHIAGAGGALPVDLNVGIPRQWLFLHRWTEGGMCPRTGRPLARATIGGRTTCWSPARQKLR
jgi:formamidopyrimidine-DNA glycosylase